MILTKQPVLSGVEVMDTSVYTIEIVQPDGVVQVACDDLGEVRRFLLKHRFDALENVFSTAVVFQDTSVELRGQRSKKSSSTSRLELFEMTSTRNLWSTLVDGQRFCSYNRKYVLQESVLKVDYELVHRRREDQILDFSISPGIPLGAPLAIVSRSKVEVTLCIPTSGPLVQKRLVHAVQD